MARTTTRPPSKRGLIAKFMSSGGSKGKNFPWLWDGSTIFTNLDVVWGMSVVFLFADRCVRWESHMQSKLTAILVLDAVNYREQLKADQAGGLQRYSTLREELFVPTIRIRECHTRKDLGDGMLVGFFSAVNAVACAFEIQSGIAERNEQIPTASQINLRIGIHLQEVVIRENDMEGEGVNITFDLEELAEPGAICISEDVYNSVSGLLNLRFGEESSKKIKSRQDPIQVYQIQISGQPLDWLSHSRHEPGGANLEIQANGYFAPEFPFGPSTAPKYPPIDKDIAGTLYDMTFPIDHAIHNSSSFIIGRRGSGKTALLQSTLMNQRIKDNSLVIDIKGEAIFELIVLTIERTCTPSTSVETVSSLWNILFWVPIIKKLCALDQVKDDSDRNELANFVEEIPVSSSFTSNQVIITTLKYIRKRRKEFDTLGELFEMMEISGVSVQKAKYIAIRCMKKYGISSVILIDSLEDFHLDCEKMKNALKGFLKCVGEFRQPGDPVVIRCALPAELYHQFLDLSTNPVKDFEDKVQLLHWDPASLLRISALRHVSYLRLYEPEKLDGELGSLNLDNVEDVYRWWQKLLPKTVMNGLKFLEDPIPYILRHTQLQPRHIIMYLNFIAKTSQSTFDGHSIREAITQVEPLIKREILKAYEPVWPDAEKACEKVLPEMDIVNSYDEIIDAYDRSKWASERKPGDGRLDEMIQMLLEIGALGKVIDKGNGYVIGLFEYRCPLRLTTSQSDLFCIHPLFLQLGNVSRPRAENDIRLVYPFGTNVGAEDLANLRLGALEA